MGRVSRSRSTGLHLGLTATLLPVFLVVVAHLSTVSGIKCWECNSHYDKNCGDPFQSYTSEVVDCDQKQSDVSHLAAANGTLPTATICRKTVQTVNEETRIIRSCGWVPNPENMADRDCYTRTGTNQVMIYHCVCKTDECNPATTASLSTLLSVLSITIASLII